MLRVLPRASPHPLAPTPHPRPSLPTTALLLLHQQPLCHSKCQSVKVSKCQSVKVLPAAPCKWSTSNLPGGSGAGSWAAAVCLAMMMLAQAAQAAQALRPTRAAQALRPARAIRAACAQRGRAAPHEAAVAQAVRPSRAAACPARSRTKQPREGCFTQGMRGVYAGRAACPRGLRAGYAPLCATFARAPHTYQRFLVRCT